MTWSTVIAFCKSTLNGLASAMNSTGASIVWIETKGSLITCEPKGVDLCDFVLVKEMGILGVILAWVDYTLQWFKLIPKIHDVPRFMWLSRCHRAWNIVTDIVGIWSFFVLVQFVIFAEIKGADYRLNQYGELLPVLGSSLLAAILANVEVREFLWRYTGVIVQERRFWLKGLDGFFEFSRGFAEGRGIILACEVIYDELHETTAGTENLYGEVVRYGVGFTWAIFSGVMGYRYGPNLALADLFPDEIVRRSLRAISITLHGVFSMITFGVLMGVNIAKNISPIKEILSGVLALLLPAIMARAYYVHIQRDSFQSQAVMRVSLLDSDFIEEDLTAKSRVEPAEQRLIIDQPVLTVAVPPAVSSPTVSSMGQPSVRSLPDSEISYERLRAPL